MLCFENRWQLVFNRFFFNASIDIYRYHGCKIIVDYEGGDAAGVRECLVSEMYRQFFPFMNLEGPLTILDCGANGGGFPLLFHTEGYILSKVVSVEMNPYTFSRLQYNLINNLQAATQCLNMIVEDTMTCHTIKFGKGSTGDSILSTGETGKEFTIKSVNIDSLITGYVGTGVIDIVKIDIEGAEYILFAGENYDRLTQCRYIVIEIHKVNGHMPEDVIGSIRQLGFDLIKNDSDVYLFSNNHINV